jgi:hypothetical protein
MTMNKAALISTYCDNQEKIDVLLKNINIVKSYGLDVIVISPIVLPESIQKQCDYFFLTKDNPVLEWPKKAMYIWRELLLGNKKIRITTTYADYGWAGLLQVKQLSDIALMLNYDYFYHMIYDLKIDDNVKHYFDNPHHNIIFPSKRGNEIWNVGLHFMIFNRENLSQFKSLISEESYFAVRGDHAFKWLERTVNTTKSEIGKIPVEDEIYYYEGHDFFNSSPVDGIKFFVNKDDEISDNVKILFYHISEEKEIKIIINNEIYEYKINENYLIDLGFDKFNIPKVMFEYMGITYDITDTIKKIKHSTLSIIQ